MTAYKGICKAKKPARILGIEGCGNVYPLKGHGLCVSCYMEYQKIKSKQPKSVRKRLSNRKPPMHPKVRENRLKQRNFYIYDANHPEFEDQSEMFGYIWNMRNHISEISEKKLSYQSANMFAHVLSKGSYPRYKYFIDNIILLTPHEHHLLDFGTHQQREEYAKTCRKCDWGIVFKKKHELKIKYNQL